MGLLRISWHYKLTWFDVNLIYLVPSWEIKHGSGSPEVPLSGYLVFGVEMCELSGIVGSHDYYLVF